MQDNALAHALRGLRVSLWVDLPLAASANAACLNGTYATRVLPLLQGFRPSVHLLAPSRRTTGLASVICKECKTK